MVFHITKLGYWIQIIIIEFSLRPGGNLLPFVLEHTFNINYCLTYLSILQEKPNVVFHKSPPFTISADKALNISIMQNYRSNSFISMNEENVLMLSRDYLNPKNPKNLTAKIYGA